MMEIVQPAKRGRTLEEVILGLVDEGHGAVYALVEELDEEDEAAIGYRHNATSTQKREDRILKHYTLYMSRIRALALRQPFPEDKESQERALFPEQEDALYKNLRTFIIFVVRTSTGRSRTAKRITYGYLGQYRSALLFWVHRSYDERQIPRIPGSRLYNKITEAMRKATKTYGLSISGPRNTTEIGLDELKQLIDFDFYTTLSREVAECHHLAWLIGRHCAVRPGAIGRPADDNVSGHEGPAYLTFGDFKIERVDREGRFVTVVTFRNMKMNRDNDPEKASARPSGLRSLNCTLRPPQRQENIMFSVGLRVLVIGLRRGAIQGASSIEELMSSDAKYVVWKPEFQDQPVLLASKPSGRMLSSEPLRAKALTAYLQDRCIKMGFFTTPKPTFYSIRRRDARDLCKIFGPDAARAILNHDPSSRTMELYYLDAVKHMDLSAAALDEHIDDTPVAQDTMTAMKLPTLSLHGSAVRDMAEQIMRDDHDHPGPGASAREFANYKRRITRAARDVLGDQQLAHQRSLVKLVEPSERYKAMQECRLMDLTMEKARKYMAELKERPTGPGLEDQEYPGIEEDDVDHPDVAIGLPPETDLSADEVRDTDEESLEPEKVTEIPYSTAVRSFMEILLDDTDKVHNWKQNPIPCKLCQDDDTMSEEAKNRLWDERKKLEKHQSSTEHTPKARWKRAYELQRQRDGEARYPCPYCRALGIEQDMSCLKDLLRHIEGAKNLGKEHDRLVRADGWGLAGFDRDTDPTEAYKRSRSVYEHGRERKMLKRLAPELRPQYSDDPELRFGIHMPIASVIVLGGAYDSGISATRQAFIHEGSIPTYDHIDFREARHNVIDAERLEIIGYDEQATERLQLQDLLPFAG